MRISQRGTGHTDTKILGRVDLKFRVNWASWSFARLFACLGLVCLFAVAKVASGHSGRRPLALLLQTQHRQAGSP